MKRDLLGEVWQRPAARPDLGAAEWEAMLGQARRARLLGRLAQHHVAQGWMNGVPERPRRYLQGALRLIDRQHLEVRWEVACIARALRDVPTPVLMLKGAAYFVAGLPPMRGRLFADIDIMVAQDRLVEVEGALFRAGWISEERDAYNQRYYRDWMHELPPLKHVQRGTVIDVHHTITPPTSRFRVDGAKLLERSIAVDGAEGLRVLAPPDMVLHSAVHLFQEGEFDHGLRDLLDLNDLLLHFSADPSFWRALFERARELGLGEPLFHALQQIEERFGTHAPEACRALRESIRPARWRGACLAALLRLALRPNHPSSDLRFSALARYLLYVRSHFLRMPLRLAVPHLLRKAYRRRFPVPDPAVAAPAAGTARAPAVAFWRARLTALRGTERR